MLKLFPSAICLVLAVSVAGVGPLRAQQPATPSSTNSSAAETAIRAAADSFVESFRKRDAAAIAAQWTPDGVYVNEDGQRFAGREAIQAEYEALFENSPDELDMKLEIDSIRMISPQIAMEEGRVALVPQPPGENRVMSRYTAVHINQDGRWLMTDVRDTLVELPPDTGQLEDLEWLVGTWIANSKEAQVEWKCRWIENRHFLARSHSVTESGKVTSTGLEIIGVDPSTGRITSWSFPSAGGHAMGIWAPHENGWIVESSGVMKDGTGNQCHPHLSRKDKDTLVWKSVTVTVGDSLLPDTPEVAERRSRRPRLRGRISPRRLQRGIEYDKASLLFRGHRLDAGCGGPRPAGDAVSAACTAACAVVWAAACVVGWAAGCVAAWAVGCVAAWAAAVWVAACAVAAWAAHAWWHGRRSARRIWR